MDKGIVEDENLDANSLCLEDAVAHNIVDKPYVAATRYDNAYTHAALHGLMQSLKHPLWWHKVGGGEDYLALRTVDNIVEQAQHSATTARLRPVEHGAMCRSRGGESRLLSAWREVVLKESAELCNARSRDAQHSIVPYAKLVANNISIRNIYASNKGDALVDNNHLAMVAAVAKGVNDMQLYTIGGKPLSKFVGHFARAVAIDYKAYAQTLSRLTTEDCGDGVADSVAKEDVKLHVDTLFGAL